VILLDTSALIWVEQGHVRVRGLLRGARHLYVSPASLLELQFLQEAGRLRLRSTIQSIAADDRWMLDEPPAVAWFVEAAALGWTRDPFDRLLAAHARVRRWRLATSDTRLVAHLGPVGSLEL
jgi:PIN domain nuclease of toxin-antitoxin system